MPRRWKFQAYQKEQRAVTKLVMFSFGSIKTCRHDRCVGQRGLRSNLSRPRACTEQETAVSLGQVRTGRRWLRTSVFNYERMPSWNSRPHFKQTVFGWSSSHGCQVLGLLHHAESGRQRRSCHCGHLYCDERVLIFTCMDHRYMYPRDEQ